MAEVIYEIREERGGDDNEKEEQEQERSTSPSHHQQQPTICGIPNYCTVKFIQQKKKNIWAIPFFSLSFIAGLIAFVIACLKFDDFLLLVSLVPLLFMTAVVLLFGCPTPFEIVEDAFLYALSRGFFDDDFDNTPIDCGCIEEDCQMYLSKNVGHFMLSCFGVGPFGIIITLFATGNISIF